MPTTVLWVSKASMAKDDEDVLDEDQQNAFDDIMAQIKGGDSDSGEVEKPAPEEAVEGEDDFAAELERVAQEASTGKVASSSSDEVPDDDENGLDDEQQKAFESILVQIDEGNKESGNKVDESDVDTNDPSKLEKSTDESNDSAPLNAVVIEGVGIKEKSSLKTPVKGEMSVEEISDKIGDILTEIHEEKDQSRSVITEPEKADEFGEKEDTVVGASDKDASPPESKKIVEPLREAAPTLASGRGKKRIGIYSIGTVILLFLAGYLFLIQKNRIDTERATAPTTEVLVHNATDEIQQESTGQVEPKIIEDSSDVSKLKRTATTLMRLRDRVAEKQTEIDDLKGYYQTGIEAEIDAIVKILQDTKMAERSHEAAIKEPRIRLGLTAIQRRDSYILQLEAPAKQLLSNSEELLFLSRKAELLALMAEKTSDLEIEGFLHAAEETAASHRAHLDNLNIDNDSATLISTKTIWKDILGRLPKKQPRTFVVKEDAVNTDDPQIWKQICGGDLSQRHRLTQLTPAVARCLAAWDGKDLYLNNLTELSPEVAAQLVQWKGDWLGLNGLTELSPEAASHLARWKGKKLSLNGLTRLSPKVVAILSEWRGDQIELINVKHMVYWENQNTRLFLSEDLMRKRLVKGE